jgi:CarD family transcriptional regulator
VQFSVNDKVIHPAHGAGRITGIEQRGQVSENTSYYVIEIPAQRLTLRVPSGRMEQNGIRPVTAPGKLPGVLAMLRSRADLLPDDAAQRQEGMGDKLGTGRAMQLAEVVRDLTWHGHRAHLTKRDTDLLNRGRALLAAEMALASDIEIAEANRAIDAALAEGMEDVSSQG